MLHWVRPMTATPESLAKVAALLGADYSVVTKTRGGRKVRHPYIERKDCEGGGWYSKHPMNDDELPVAILRHVAKDFHELRRLLNVVHDALFHGRDPLAAVIAAAVGQEGR